MVLAVECKATRLTYLAQFAEDPFETARNQYRQIANGVFQLWRFFSHIRRGLVNETVDGDTSAMVLTLDPFLTLSRELRDRVIHEASELAKRAEDISAEDRRHVIFCPIQGLEDILSRSTEDSFLATLKAARKEKYTGWDLREISREEAAGEKIELKRFPFDLSDLLPWWKRCDKFDQAKDAETP
jgi:hypothetical protein